MNDIIELSVIEEYTAIIEANIQECNELLTEKIDWQQFKTNVVTAAKKAWRWIVKRAIYIKESFLRLYKANKAKKMHDQYEKLMKTQGWAVEFDDLPGDVYDDFFEAGESELVAGLTENDIKTFGRNIIKNKKLIIKSLLNIGLNLAPGIGPAKLAIELNKAFLTLIPVLTDFIATAKEIALLKKKYAGKVKTFKRSDGTIEMEIPAEEYITVDKYIGLANRIINLIIPTNGKSEITCKITGTKDLIQVFKATMYTMDAHDSKMEASLNKLIEAHTDACEAISTELNTAIKNNATDNDIQQIVAKLDKEDESFNATYNSIMASHQPMSANEIAKLAISAASDIMSKSVSFYMDGIEYKIKGKYINELLMPITANLSAAYVEAMKTCEELDKTGANCLMMSIKCAGIMLKHIAPTMVKSANAINKNITGNENIRNPKDSREVFKHIAEPTGRRATRAITMESVYMEAGPREEVRDGFLGDLPEDIRIKVMNIHKMVVATVNEVFKNKAYDPIRNTAWAKTMIEEFLIMPQDKTATGSVRLYKKGKKHSCMIQLTGHVNNNRNDIDHELFHDFIRNVHQSMRKDVRRKYDMTLTCESEHGEHFEGFDVWTTAKVAKQLWDKFADMKTKKAEFHSESVESNTHYNVMAVDIEDLPIGLQEMIESINNDIQHSKLISDIGFTEIIEHTNGTYEGSIVISDECEFNESFDMNKYCEALNEYDSTKEIVYNEETNQYELQLTPEYAKYLARYCESNDPQYFTEVKYSPLQFDFRKVYDMDTGHLLKLIYSLDNIHIVFPGKSYGDDDHGYDPNTPKHQADIKDAEKNIRKNGNGDHCSYGQTLLAIVDVVDNKQLQFARIIGPYAAGLSSVYSKLPKDNLEWANNKYGNTSRVTTVHVGEIEDSKHPTFKTTHWFNKSITQNKTLGGKIRLSDNTTLRMNTAEGIRNLRAPAKTNDIVGDYSPKKAGKPVKYNHPSKKDIRDNPELYANEYYDDYIAEYDCYIEAANEHSEKGDAKLTLKNTKAALNSLYSEGKIPNQYTADIYSNLITKNLLPIWADGFRKFTIVLDTKTDDSIFEFKIPAITQDFVSRFIAGREPLNGLLRRNPDIKVRMSAAAFKTMKSPDDAYKFFMAAIKYYNEGVQRYSEKIMSNYMKLDHETKHLISTTKLSGLVTLPLQWLFQFDHVDMSDPSIFKINSGDLQKINSFVRTIYSKYASPEKEKQKVLSDLAELIKTTRNASTNDDENVKNTSKLTEAVSDWYFGKMKDTCDKHNEEWIREQTDLDWLRNPPTPEIKLLQESTKMKKLKKIPRDIIAYITIEAESIRDSGDKMLIASYCLSKLEIVEWYIELLDVGSKKYIVPHTRPYLEMMRTELLKCYDKIMKVKIIPPSERPIVDIKYPKGYEG